MGNLSGPIVLSFGIMNTAFLSSATVIRSAKDLKKSLSEEYGLSYGFLMVIGSVGRGMKGLAVSYEGAGSP
jgi:hypothetical protein